MLSTHGREIGLWTFAAGILASVACYSLALLTGSGHRAQQWFLTATVLFAFALAAGVASMSLERAPLRRLTGVMLGVTLAGCAVWLFLAWLPAPMRARWDAPLFLGAFWVALAALVLVFRVLLVLPRVDRAVGRSLRAVATVLACVGAVAAGVMVYAETYEQYALRETVSRVMGVGVITAIGAWLALNIVSLIEQRVRERAADPSIARRVRTSMVCPRCAASVTIESNKPTRCPNCRLRLRLQVDEPRCTCGYVLYRLEGDTCPECGRPVPAEDRWAAAKQGDMS